MGWTKAARPVQSPESGRQCDETESFAIRGKTKRLVFAAPGFTISSCDEESQDQFRRLKRAMPYLSMLISWRTREIS